MEKTLENHHPVLLIEIHGKDAATHCLPLLEETGYHFQNMEGKHFESADAFLDSFPDVVAQVLCTTKKRRLFTFN
jgi:hypothetical protein